MGCLSAKVHSDDGLGASALQIGDSGRGTIVGQLKVIAMYTHVTRAGNSDTPT